jgi:hypothetical protein
MALHIHMRRYVLGLQMQEQKAKRTIENFTTIVYGGMDWTAPLQRAGASLDPVRMPQG